ncbi:DNA-binding protein [Limosilactobacillus reuteri]|uniref:DNA-binding protein n=1 Tax=Limosilactobacillus reuteri TaxID=1598 RepID=A0A317GI04_LIMRT|nr:helix-turn-helix domain-containing protein [Limosilactobacillus reuteri]MCH5385714.1 helix-turn-helix domain-containing protein [Limosilactobacillus reuteri]PWT47064.1 DNA-binding protein [Limosilactobacillus reuteri]PWT51480.1 DNA-binding protein [Limosilactobacillus reuteri]PWT62237.1 DNA-binding protein [Limosilactobacillus reuteri]
MEPLKVELPKNITDAITTAVFETFRSAQKSSNDEWPLYLSKKQACKYLNISNKTLDEWIATGDIPYKHIGKTYRFNRNDLDKFMATK